MDSIIKLMKDPSWWFAVVFAGIIFGLIAGYFKDGISSIVARMSKSCRVRRETTLLREKERTELLVAHPSLLIMEIIWHLRDTALFFAIYIIYLLLPVFDDVVTKSTYATTLDLFLSRKFFLASVFLFGGLEAFLGFWVVSRMRFVMNAWREYRMSIKRNQP